MHCGFCLPSCPTYAETGRERNSPRGRIALMRAVAEGELPLSRGFAEEMDYCLGCLACTTACPAGVDFTTLLETARAEAEASGVAASAKRSALRAVFFRFVFTRPRLLRALGRALWLWQASGAQTLARRLHLPALLPRRLRQLETQTPAVARHFSDALIAEVTPAVGARRHRVLVLTGCVQDIVFSDINRATVEVLAENGCEVVTPRAQSCCGSLHAHHGDPDTARLLARRQLDAIDPSAFDAIISNSAGCGSHLKRYGHLLADDPAYAARAAEWSRKLRDVSEWLVETGFQPPQPETGLGEHPTSNIQRPTPNLGAEPPRGAPVPLDVGSSMLDVGRSFSGVPPLNALTYHDACHLCHGQKITAQPRALIRALPGTELRECADSTTCCGAAGLYSLTHPETSARLLERKLDHLATTGATTIAVANPGCHLQLAHGLRQRGGDAAAVRIAHPVVLLAEAYRRERAPHTPPAT